MPKCEGINCTTWATNSILHGSVKTRLGKSLVWEEKIVEAATIVADSRV